MCEFVALTSSGQLPVLNGAEQDLDALGRDEFFGGAGLDADTGAARLEHRTLTDATEIADLEGSSAVTHDADFDIEHLAMMGRRLPFDDRSHHHPVPTEIKKIAARRKTADPHFAGVVMYTM